jgi:hypothetical protein
MSENLDMWDFWLDKRGSASDALEADYPELLKSDPEHLIPLGAQLVHSDTNVMCIPLVTDKPIRGYRSNNLVCDDWPVISKEIFDEVMKGFA